MPGPGLPQCLRPQSAGRRAGRAVFDRASGQSDSLAGAVWPDRGAVRPRGGPVRHGQRHPGGALRQGPAQGRGDAPYLEAAAHDGHSKVVAVGVAQEFQRVFTGYDRGRGDGRPGPPRYGFEKADRRVSCYYFSVWDEQFGPGFIKLCSYFPWPAKVWVNGHEWPSSRPASAASGSASWQAGSPPATTRIGCSRCATGSAPPSSRRSSTAGWPTSDPLGATDRAGGPEPVTICSRSPLLRSLTFCVVASDTS